MSTPAKTSATMVVYEMRKGPTKINMERTSRVLLGLTDFSVDALNRRCVSSIVKPTQR